MSLSANFPALRPTLLLNFARAKRLDPRITFTRTTTATYYDGETVAKAEENLLIRSQEFHNAAWGKTRSTVTANTDTAPDGTLTADSLLQASGQTVSGLVVSTTLNYTATTFVASVFAKPNGKNFICVTILDVTAGNVFRQCFFNVSTGTVGTSANGAVGTITAAANGYYRCSIAYTFTGSGTFDVRFFVADTDNSNAVTDSGGLYIWGAQLEQRSAVTAYTPTTTQPITNYIPVLLTAPAGVARFDHNPVTEESLGLLIEEQRTNLALRSEEFDNAYWLKAAATVQANTAIAPDGTLTGDKLVENTSSAEHIVYVPRTGSNETLTISVFAKAASRNVRIGFSNFLNAAAFSSFDLINGTILATGPTSADYTNISSSIVSVGNGWYRCSVTATKGSVNTTNNPFITSLSGPTAVYAGNGYDGVFVWGAQLEAGPFPTSYIPTAAATATRNADSVSMTGTNFSSWYNATEGVVCSETALNSSVAGNRGAFDITSGSTDNRILYRAITTGGFDQITIRSGGTTQVQSGVNSLAATTSATKFAVAYKVNDFAATTNAQTVFIDTSGLVPAGNNQITIGAAVTNSEYLNGYIQRITYYPVRLSNAQLQALTS